MRLTYVQRWPSRTRLRAVLTGLALLFTLLIPAARPATAAPVALPAESLSKCTRSSGVLVVVDFRHFGESVDRGCAPTPTTGLDALTNAGYSVTGTAQYGDAFICRLDDRPSANQQSCQSTPPANAYWSYWHAQAGQDSWTYSSEGAAKYHPPPGSIDAWTFGSGAAPTFTPAEIRAGSTGTTTTTSSTTTTTTVPTTTTRPTTTTTAPVGSKTTTTEHHETTTTTRRDHHPKAKAKRPPTHERAAHSPKTDPSTTTPPTIALKIASAGGATKGGSSGGSPTGLIVGLVLVAVLGAAAFFTARRRRRPAG